MEVIENKIFTSVTDWISSAKNIKFVGLSKVIDVSYDTFRNVRTYKTKAKPTYIYKLVAAYPEVSNYFYSLLEELNIKKEGYEVGIGIETLLKNGYSVEDIHLGIEESATLLKKRLQKPEVFPDRIHLKFKKAFPDVNKSKDSDLEAKIDELNKKMEEQGRKLDWLIEQQQKNK